VAGFGSSKWQLDLDPHHLAAATAAVVTETPRPDSWVHALSPEVEEALAGLRSTRRQLFQLQRRYNIALPLGCRMSWLPWWSSGHWG